MSETLSGRAVRRIAASVVFIIFLAAAAGTGRAARSDEGPYAYCQRMLAAGLAKAVAIAVITPADFKYFFYSSLAGYEWCRKFLM